MRYHVEIFHHANLQTVQDRANAYLEECEELDISVHNVKLQENEFEWILTILFSFTGGKGLFRQEAQC